MFTAVKRESGFTLIEIMIVVLIIAMLLMIAVPSWMGAREKTQIRSCMKQLRDLNYAKQNWAMDGKKASGDVPVWDDLQPYLRSHPVCPAGGDYTFGSVSTDPTCSIPGHVLD